MEKKNAMVAEKHPNLTPSTTQRGHISPYWLTALTAIPLLGMVAAFGIAPDTSTETVVLHRVVEDIPSTLATATEGATDEQFWREERIQRGDTIGSLLARLQVEDPDATAYLRNARHLQSLYQLVPGRTVRAVTTRDGELVTLRYRHGDGTELVVQKHGDDFFAHEQQLPTEARLLMSAGEIQTSLFAATDAAGLSDSVAVQLADIFSGEVDFHRDLQPGDHFSVVYEAFYSNGEFVRTGRIMAAEFTSGERVFRAVYFQNAQGGGGYYTPDGKNMRRTFLRSPLEFSRITSGFSSARFHPVLNTWRAHKGVDYGAPIGTRVKSTSDGYIQFAGRQGGYGNVIIVRHNNGYSTAYGHLSGFAKGIHTGQRVNQGDVIGYVGMSGLATGPHLHYEFRVNGVHQNPLKLAVPQGTPITAQAKATFTVVVGPLLDQLNLIRGMNIASSN